MTGSAPCGVVLHPGSTKGRTARAVAETGGESDRRGAQGNRRLQLLLEQTAGHKGLIGRNFDETAELIDLAGGGERLGLCLDSCHMFVQGYDITDEDHLAAVLDEADEKVGIERLGAIHVNDAAAPLGSCRDRHANIGKGEMGGKGLAAFLSEPRFEGLPATLETPGPEKKGPSKAEVNAKRKLRREGLRRRED